MNFNAKSLWPITIGTLFGLLGAGIILLVTSNPRGEPVELLPPPTAGQITVHISGAVNDPDVYALPPGSRVQDAINVAGGLSKDAYESVLNLALPLNDGDKVFVPRIPTPGNPPAPDETQTNVAFPININTATAEELKALPGIGPSLAAEIIGYRERHGPFNSPEKIRNVSGIGPSTYDQIKDMITIGE